MNFAIGRCVPAGRWVAALLALLTPGATLAATEKLCSDLGSKCICSEPLNGNTHDGGSTSWEWGSPWKSYDMDDSPLATSCFPRTRGAETGCSASPGMKPVSAASEAAFLPPGNSLSYVMRHKGDSICHIGHPDLTFNQSTGNTYCIRHYRRWDANSQFPGDYTSTQEPQQKVSTIGGCREGTYGGGGCDLFKAQISVSPRSQSGVSGQMNGGADTNWQGTPGTIPDFGNAKRDCVNNYCRVEVCMDYSKSGYFRVRRRVVEVAPGSGEMHPPGGDVVVGTVSRPSSKLVGSGPSGIVWFGQYTPGLIDYASHFIVVGLPYEDQNFWPGPACEFEGGCSGGGSAPPPPPPEPPASPPAAPILIQ